MLSIGVLPHVEAEVGSTKVSKVLGMGGSSTDMATKDIQYIKGAVSIWGSILAMSLSPTNK
jgi:hypothetical protein